MADPKQITIEAKSLCSCVPSPLSHTRRLDVLCVRSGWPVVQRYRDLVTGAQGEKKRESKVKRTATEWREISSSVKESKRLVHVIRPKWVFHWASGSWQCSARTKLEERSESHSVRHGTRSGHMKTVKAQPKRHCFYTWGCEENGYRDEHKIR